MKRLILGVGLLLFATVASAMYISETQATVQAGLEDLGFQVVERKDGLIGAPTEFEVTQKTIKQLKKLQKQGKRIRLAADGRITVGEPTAKGVEQPRTEAE